MAEDLESRLAAVCGVLNAAHAQLIQLVGEVVDTGVWDVPGVRSVEQWVAWKTGLAPARAKQTVQIASRSKELPVTLRSFAAGEVSIDQVAVVAKFAPARNDVEVAGVAKCATVSQLRAKLGWYWKVVVPTEVPGEPIMPESERVDVAMAFFDDDGRWRMHADYAAERGAVLQKALEEARDALFTAGNTNVTWADAFEEVCLRSLATIKSVSRSDRYRVLVHLNEDGGWLNGGQHLKDSVLKQLLSNTTIQAVFERGGRPVNLGRSARVVPHRIAALIVDRDRMCRNPLCSATKGLETHHVVHWTNGGPTNTGNLGALCRHCHRAHHAGKFTITGNADDPDGLIFRRPDGTVIEGAAKPTSPDGPLPQSVKRFVHPTGERWLSRDTWFTPTPPPNRSSHHASTPNHARRRGSASKPPPNEPSSNANTASPTTPPPTTPTPTPSTSTPSNTPNEPVGRSAEYELDDDGVQRGRFEKTTQLGQFIEAEPAVASKVPMFGREHPCAARWRTLR